MKKLDPKVVTLGQLQQIAKEKGRLGRVATSDRGLVHWREGALAPDKTWNKRTMSETPIPRHMVEKMHEGLPPVIRRHPRERYQVLINRLVEEGMRTYRVYGYPVWPKSIQDELRVMGWKEGDPNLYGQVEALARKFIEEGAQKQRQKDQGKSALDWHGHYSA